MRITLISNSTQQIWISWVPRSVYHCILYHFTSHPFYHVKETLHTWFKSDEKLVCTRPRHRPVLFCKYFSSVHFSHRTNHEQNMKFRFYWVCPSYWNLFLNKGIYMYFSVRSEICLAIQVTLLKRRLLIPTFAYQSTKVSVQQCSVLIAKSKIYAKLKGYTCRLG